jgi:hypothetical protein
MINTSDKSLEEILENLGIRRIDKIQISDFPSLQKVCRAIALLSVIGFVLFVYSALVSKCLPDTGVYIVDAVKYDYYFCYLIPLMILPTYIVIYLQWLSMKMFEYN